MKIRNYAIAMGMAAALTLGTMAPLFAQSTVLKANVPFDFYVADKLMPSGTYVIKAIPGSSVIKVYDGRNGAFVMTSTVKGRDRNNTGESMRNLLVFHRYGHSTFLSEFHWEGYREGWRTLDSDLEREARKGADPSPLAITLRK